MDTFLSLQGEPPAKKGRVNPQVYMDIKIGNKPAGRLRFLLRADIVPMTVGQYTLLKHVVGLTQVYEDDLAFLFNKKISCFFLFC